jgi:hypothetical protein
LEGGRRCYFSACFAEATWLLLLLLLLLLLYACSGTEMGVTEPEATFSACFGGAFLMWHPMKYAAMLAEKMKVGGAAPRGEGGERGVSGVRGGWALRAMLCVCVGGWGGLHLLWRPIKYAAVLAEKMKVGDRGWRMVNKSLVLFFTRLFFCCHTKLSFFSFSLTAFLSLVAGARHACLAGEQYSWCGVKVVYVPEAELPDGVGAVMHLSAAAAGRAGARHPRLAGEHSLDWWSLRSGSAHVSPPPPAMLHLVAVICVSVGAQAHGTHAWLVNTGRCLQ